MSSTDSSLESSTVFHIPGMDCPSEEHLIRLALSSLEINSLAFNLNQRKLTIRHRLHPEDILSKLKPLGFGAVIESNQRISEIVESSQAPASTASQKNVLMWLLSLNASMFFIEVTAGWYAHSAGLIADGIDMFSDAAVYGVSLFVVGRAAAYQLKAAKLAGFIQIALAIGIFGRVAYQISFNTMPAPDSMIGFSFLALIVNIVCLYLVAKHRNDGVHMKASFIFSANDVITNLGVIFAGFLVAWFSSPYPDWIIGTIIGVVVLAGGIRILKL